MTFLQRVLIILPLLLLVTSLDVPAAIAITEWSALGDSYASGIGAGTPDTADGLWCYRFNQSYTAQLQLLGIQPKPQTANYLACSGNTFDYIINNQLRDEAHCAYIFTEARRLCYPTFGKTPSFATLSMGGNDINILGLVQTCILNLNILGKPCDQLIHDSFAAVRSKKFQDDATSVIKAILDKGTRTSGPSFHIYLLSYAQFFNADTTQCNRISFQPKRWPADPSKVFLTRGRRKRMNNLALALNAALKMAADSFESSQITWIDYDSEFETHRFCDREEANADDPQTWFFNFNTTVDPPLQSFPATTPKTITARDDTTIDALLTKAGFLGLNGQPTKIVANDTEFLRILNDAAGDDPDMQNALWNYVRICHPKSPGHEKIMSVLLPYITGGAQISLSGDGTDGSGDSLSSTGSAADSVAAKMRRSGMWRM